jgi:predicted deacylase
MDSKSTLSEAGGLVDFSRALEERVQRALTTYACAPDIAGNSADYAANME